MALPNSKDGKDSIMNNIKWNFAKFLVGRDGKVIKRYMPQTSPNQIEDDIKAALSSAK